MTEALMNRIKAQLVRHEGMRLKPYRCTAAKLNIGIGRNLDDRDITQKEAYAMLERDIQDCEQWLIGEIPEVYNKLDEVRQSVLLNICFNLGIRIARELTDIAKYRSLPEFIVCDNGPEFRSSVMFKWSQDNKVELSFIAPGKPQQNAFVESFNGKFRKECLDLNCFRNLLEVRDVIMNWRLDYNPNRPHSSLNYITPTKFRENYENNVDSKRVTLQVV